MKRRSFLGLLGGAVVAPFAKATPIEASEPIVFNRVGPIIDDVLAGAAPIQGAYYPPALSVKMWAKALERDVIYSNPDLLFKGELGQMSSVVIKRTESDIDFS